MNISVKISGLVQVIYSEIDLLFLQLNPAVVVWLWDGNLACLKFKVGTLKRTCDKCKKPKINDNLMSQIEKKNASI